MKTEQFTIEGLRHSLITEGDAAAGALRKLTQQRDELVADYSRDTEVLRGQVKYAEQQRDELLAALRWLADCAADYGVDDIQLADARKAISRAEGRAE